MQICFIGDELATGVDDPRGLGWVGRVNVHSIFDLPAMLLILAVPSETTKQMAARWEIEVLPHLAEGEPHGLAIGAGPGDVATGISTARSRLSLANIIDRVTTLGIPSFVVGPPSLAGVDSGLLKVLSSSCSEVCARRGIPFADCYTPLVAHDQWFEDMVASLARGADGQTLSSQAGYALMTWIIQHQGWYEWTGATPANVQYLGMRSNNPHAPPTGSEPAPPEENVEVAHRVPRNGPVPVEPSTGGFDPTFPHGVSASRTEDEKLVETLPLYISEAHADSEPTAPVPRAASPSAATQRDRSSSPIAARFHVTSTGTDPQDSSTPKDKSTKAFILPIPVHVFAGLTSVITILLFTSIGIARVNDFGTATFQWQFAACLFGLAAVGLCIPFTPATVCYTRILPTEGKSESAGTRVSGYTFICLAGLAAAVISISNAVPAARDFIEGPHVTTVSSYWLYQRPAKSSPTNTSPSSYRNGFNITLNDKSTLVLIIETEKWDELQSTSGISGILYKGCELCLSSKKPVLGLYPRT